MKIFVSPDEFSGLSSSFAVFSVTERTRPGRRRRPSVRRLKEDVLMPANAWNQQHRPAGRPARSGNGNAAADKHRSRVESSHVNAFVDGRNNNLRELSEQHCNTPHGPALLLHLLETLSGLEVMSLFSTLL